MSTANDVARSYLEWMTEKYGFPGTEEQTREALMTLELAILCYMDARERLKKE